MYLKSIEVQGFKSFANKILFEFHNGITGIVGPNGSGKSNVADAVRWVLGEQSVKQLRGSNMQDVIFSGTELRKPLSFASVAITIDNGDHMLDIDYKEVTVTRRLYRSGESEYLLNGSQCRLRDIRELFYDTGIGKEGYSIIGQGQIDKVLSGKPEDRRELFDEAAGIVKFKRRKDTAQKKLESEKANLQRANDILAEIERRLGPLERQSQAARVYLARRDELKTYDVNLFLLETERMKAVMTEIEDSLHIAEDQLKEVTEANEQLRLEYDRRQEEIEALEQEIEKIRSAHSETVLRREQLEGQLNVLRQQQLAAEQNDTQYENRLSVLSEDMAAHLRELEDMQKQLRDNADSREQTEKHLADEEARLEELSRQEEDKAKLLEVLQNDLLGLADDNASLQAGQQRFDTLLEQTVARQEELARQLTYLKSTRQTQQQMRLAGEKSLETIGGRIEKALEQTDITTRELAEAKERLSRAREAYQNGQVSYHQTRTRLDSLVNMTERYEGYGGSIRAVMEQKKKHPGIIGVVADILQTEKKYETAIETALGGSIQNIVTEDEPTAREMVAYLKKNRAGRATFLPLTSIQGKKGFSRPEALQEPGVIAQASQLVRADGRYDTLRYYLLGRFLVVDHMDHALALAKKYGYSLRIVTLEGELLSPGGSITGGAFKNSSNLLGRRRELDELSGAVREQENKLKDLQSDVEQLEKEEEKLLRRDASEKEAFQKLSLEQNTAKIRLSQAEEACDRVEKEYARTVEENNRMTAQADRIRKQQREMTDSLDAAADRKKQMEQQLAREQELLEQLRGQDETLQAKITELRIELSGTEQQKTFLEENIQRIREELERLKEEETGIHHEQKDARSDARRQQEDRKALEDAIARAGEEASLRQAELEKQQAVREELTGVNRSFFQNREELTEQIAALDKECFRLQHRKERLEEEREQQINYMWDEYQLTFSSAAELKDDRYSDRNELRSLIKETQGAIKQLGPVNVNAIEEYKETSERHTFLKTQRDDLVKAEETLLGIIRELDEGMRKQFEEQFGKIKVEFNKAFRQLFGGGRGTLELVEDEDVLEAGVRIIAQPPGKKLQNMMQLSGGEKALTAIALLFAFQNLKPSPFCLLDEIEAALDDSNVGRYAQYLHKLTEHTQFIIITHRKGTMAAADRLYGITMQEKGVSTLVSVNLIEADLDQ